MDPVIIGAILVGAVLVVVLAIWLRRGQDVVVVPPVPPAPPGGDMPPEVQALLARGQKIEAIKRVRELTGWGLKESKDYVEAFQLGVSPAASIRAAAPVPNSDPRTIEQEARETLASGNAIAAIKRVRERTGLGLKEAKDYVDALQSGAAPPALPVDGLPGSPASGAMPLDQEARALLTRGQKIEAIKRVRELTGWGLKEAKDYVERL